MAENDKRMTEEMAQQWLNGAVAAYDPQNRIMSSVLDNTSSSSSTPTTDRIAQVGLNAQFDLTKIQEANGYIRQYINTNDIIGLVVSAVQSSINTDMRLSYQNVGEHRNKARQLKKAQQVIDDFNKQINVRELIRTAILTTYTEGNYICVLRHDGEGWVVTQYPLGIAEISPYLEASMPIVQINMQSLKDALQRTVVRSRDGKALYYENVAAEIEAAFGPEIAQAYKNNDQYCRMPTAYTGVCRVNTQGGYYGLSYIFRCLTSAVILDSLRNADMAIAASKSKTIIHQVMRKEMTGANRASNFELLAWNHKNLLSAFRQNTVLVTTDPSVESIQYICPQEQEISTDKQNAYARQILSSLGVSFLVPDDGQSASTVKISWQVLLQQINAIGEQVERMLENFYTTVLMENGIDYTFCPTVRIIDAEMLDAAQRVEYAKLLYSTLGCSMQTTLSTIGINLEDEKMRREQENEDGIDQIFTPHLTSFTAGSGDFEGEAGRPAETDPENPDKQDYDQDYNEEMR